jgi:hypothetical protein
LYRRPRYAPCVRTRAQRQSLGLLFLLLAVAFAGIAWAAAQAGQWVIVAGAAAIGVWLGGLAARGLRAR